MDDNSQVNDQPNDSNTEVVAEETQSKENTVQYDSYRKVVGKNKKVMSENEDLRTRLTTFEQDKMANEGRKDELIKSLRSELDEVKTGSQKQQQAYAWNLFSSNVKAEASKRGCINPEKLIRLLDKEDLGSVEVDDNYNVNGDDLNRLMDKAMKENEFLFGKGSVKVNDVTPDHNRPKTGKSLSEMTTQEKLIALAEMDS